MLTAGSCTVLANQAGNANYSAAAQVSLSVTINKANQCIGNFSPTIPVLFGASAQTLSASGGASGNAVTFSLISGPCVLAGESLSYTGAGSCVVAANQLGNGNYNAAKQANARIIVNSTGGQITLTSSVNRCAQGSPVTFTAMVVQVAPASAASAAQGGLKAGTTLPGIPTGNVTFADGATVLATVPLDATGRASFTTSTLLAGTHAITATYNGDSGNATAGITLAQQVAALPVPGLSGWMLVLPGLMLVGLAQVASRRVGAAEVAPAGEP